jgi:hypothetical protein
MVADLTVDELRNLIQDVVTQSLRKAFEDPDQGLELNPDMEREIRHSLEYVDAGGSVISAKDVAARLNLDW